MLFLLGVVMVTGDALDVSKLRVPCGPVLTTAKESLGCHELPGSPSLVCGRDRFTPLGD